MVLEEVLFVALMILRMVGVHSLTEVSVESELTLGGAREGGFFDRRSEAVICIKDFVQY